MILIENMKMPRGCYQCVFMTHCEECEGHHNHCILDEDEHGFGNHSFSNLEWKYPIVPMERPSWCPLIEIKAATCSPEMEEAYKRWATPEWQLEHKRLGFASPLADLYEMMGVYDEHTD